MQPSASALPKTEVEMLLRLRRAEAEVLCRECEELIEDNANVEAQIAAAETLANATIARYD